jgi:glycosyltransferase involved in cell wall biosynthesis
MDDTQSSKAYDVIIPMKNGVKFIKQALDSVMGQTLKPSRVIVVNDHSVDGSVEFLLKNFPRVTLLHSSHQGQAHALNLGLNSANNKFISFLDADDLWCPKKQETQIELLESFPNMQYVSSGVRNFFDGDKNEQRYQDFFDSRALGACTFRREVFANWGLFNTQDYSKVAIIEFFSRIRELPKVSSNSIEMFRRIHHENSWITERAELTRNLFRFLRENR